MKISPWNRMIKKVPEECAGERLDSFISSGEEMSRAAAQKLISGGFVTVNGKKTQKSERLQAGDTVEYTVPAPVPDEAKPENIPLDIVYEDEWLLVVNKPKGMVVHPGAGNPDGTLVNALLAHCGDGLSGVGGVLRPGIVHRIDKDTGGLLLVAKNDAAHISLSEQIKRHTAGRIYEAVVIGAPPEDAGTVDAPIGRHPVMRKKMAVISGGREAVTHYAVEERFRGYSLVKFRLETGRTHQIRVHMAHIGHPILGDELYGGVRREISTSGQTLQAVEISFVHPATGEHMTFRAARQPWFEEILDKVRKL